MEDAKRRPGRLHFVLAVENPAGESTSWGAWTSRTKTMSFQEGEPLPPTPPHCTSREISPELVLIDRELLPISGDDLARLTTAEVDNGVREATLRMCELSDVNPPRRRRHVLAFAGPVTLWAEAALFVAAHVPLGAL
jgi:hypothetical protein